MDNKNKNIKGNEQVLATAENGAPEEKSQPEEMSSATTTTTTKKILLKLPKQFGNAATDRLERLLKEFR